MHITADISSTVQGGKAISPLALQNGKSYDLGCNQCAIRTGTTGRTNHFLYTPLPANLAAVKSVVSGRQGPEPSLLFCLSKVVDNLWGKCERTEKSELRQAVYSAV